MNPKKTIKNITRKSFDEFDWIRDTEPISIYDKNWIIHNDVGHSEEEERRIQEWIYSQGYVWPDDWQIEDMLDGNCEYYFNADEVYFDAYGAWNSSLDSMISYDGYELLNWSDIKKQLNLNESEEEVGDGLDWIRKAQTNPWIQYDYITIDTTPAEENIELLINLALGSGRVSESSLESWSEDLDGDVRQIINYFYEYDKSYLRISDGGNLMYGYEVEPYGEWTKYSKIFQENINESEEDEFDWIRKSEPLSYDYLIGKGLEFWPPIEDEDSLTSILNFLANLGFHYNNWGIDWDYETIMGLYLDDRGRIIYTSDNIDEDYGEHITDYAGKPVTVLDGWDELRGYLNESSDDDNPLKWIEDIPTGIELQPNTLYYFKPDLKIDEVRMFANNVINSDYIKEFLLNHVTERLWEKGPDKFGLKYFGTGENVNGRVRGWCTSTPPEGAIRKYQNYVDGRREFNVL